MLSAERQQLVIDHLWIADAAVRRYTRKAPQVREDVLQTARLALVACAETWQGEKLFRHWAWWPCLEAAKRQAHTLQSTIHSPKQFRDSARANEGPESKYEGAELSCEMVDPGLEKLLDRMQRVLEIRGRRGRRATITVAQTLEIYIRTTLGLGLPGFSTKQIENALVRARWAAGEVVGCG